MRALAILALPLALTNSAGASNGEEPKEGLVNWIVSQVHVQKRAGLEIRHVVRIRKRDCVVAVQGPALGRDAYGLKFEIRF